MYIEITDRCNMHCPHCAVDCTDHGWDMPKEVFHAAIDMISDIRQDSIIRGGLTRAHLAWHAGISGGEPTLHPQLWEFISIACDKLGEAVDVCTNGKRTRDALRLMDMAESGLIDVYLSLDRYHEQIDPEVIYAFNRAPTDHKHIACMGDDPFRVGRAAINELSFRPGCVCCEPFISPGGVIYACGCRTEIFGTVFQCSIPKRIFRTQWYCSTGFRGPSLM
jgi:MoaA/NifB/PqqE/SkfB family radical SAM enzyme